MLLKTKRELEISLCREQASTCFLTPKRRGESAVPALQRRRCVADPTVQGKATRLRRRIRTSSSRFSKERYDGVPEGRIEADPRHVKEVIKAVGLEGATLAPTAGVAAKRQERPGSKTTKAASTPSGGMRRHHVLCGRGEAELLSPRRARHYVRLHETLRT